MAHKTKEELFEIFKEEQKFWYSNPEGVTKLAGKAYTMEEIYQIFAKRLHGELFPED